MYAHFRRNSDPYPEYCVSVHVGLRDEAAPSWFCTKASNQRTFHFCRQRPALPAHNNSNQYDPSTVAFTLISAYTTRLL